MLTDYKSNVKQQEIKTIILAQKQAAQTGNAKAVVSLSKLLNKRLKRINDFRFETCQDQTK